MRLSLVEWSPYVVACAVEYKTLIPIPECPRPGWYAEFMHAALALAHINYTLIQTFFDFENGTTTWGSYVEDIDYFDGELGKLKDQYDMILSPYTLPDANRERLLLWFVPGGSASLATV